MLASEHRVRNGKVKMDERELTSRQTKKKKCWTENVRSSEKEREH